MNGPNYLRLLWKEYREGWPVILAFILLPEIIFPLCKVFSGVLVLQGLACAILFGVPLTAVLWASEKRRMIKQGRDLLAATLPVSPIQDWITLFLTPALAVGLCGGFMCATCLFYAAIPEWRIGFWEGAAISIIAFMFSSFLSKSVSHLLGIIVGTFWILAAAAFQVTHGPLIWIPILLAVAGLGLSESRKYGPKKQKAFGVVVLISLVLIFQWNTIAELLHNPSARLGGQFNDVSVTGKASGKHARAWTDGPHVINYEEWSSNRALSVKPVTIKHVFSGLAIPVGIANQARVCILNQKPGSSDVSIVRWDPKTDRIDSLITLDSKTVDLNSFNKGFMSYLNPYEYMPSPGIMDDHETKLLLNLSSSIGLGRDLVIVDITTGAHKLLLANTIFAWSNATWMKDKVYLTGIFPAYEINTKDFTVKPLVTERKGK